MNSGGTLIARGPGLDAVHAALVAALIKRGGYLTFLNRMPRSAAYDFDTVRPGGPLSLTHLQQCELLSS